MAGDASALAELAVERQLILQVGHVERFNPVLGALLYVTFLQVTAAELLRSLRDGRFLGRPWW